MRQATPLVLCFATVLLASLLVQPMWAQRAYVGGLGGGTFYNKTNITSGLSQSNLIHGKGVYTVCPFKANRSC